MVNLTTSIHSYVYLHPHLPLSHSLSSQQLSTRVPHLETPSFWIRPSPSDFCSTAYPLVLDLPNPEPDSDPSPKIQTKASNAPIHTTWQIWFRQIPAFRIIHTSNLLHANKITLHDRFAFAYNHIVALIYRSANPLYSYANPTSISNPNSCIRNIISRTKKGASYHHDPMGNFLSLVYNPGQILVISVLKTPSLFQSKISTYGEGLLLTMRPPGLPKVLMVVDW